MWGGGGGATEG